MSMETVKKINYLKIYKSFLIALIGTIFLAISAKIKIPFYPVPMTMQTFVVLVIAVGFGWRLALARMASPLMQSHLGVRRFETDVFLLAAHVRAPLRTISFERWMARLQSWS